MQVRRLLLAKPMCRHATLPTVRQSYEIGADSAEERFSESKPLQNKIDLGHRVSGLA